MNAEWMFDARKIPDLVMNYLRRIAVRAIEEKHYSPELVADLFGIDRTSIYDWLRKYRQQGEEALDTRKAPSAPWVITPDIDAWLKETKGPIDFEHRLYDALLKLQEFKERVQSFFRLPDTQYAGSQMSPA